MQKLLVGIVASLVPILGCQIPLGDDGAPGTDAGTNELGLPAASSFSCDTLDGSEEACVDFNDGEAPFQPEGGEWSVVDGWLVGLGPDAAPGPCGDSLMTHNILQDVEVQDLGLSARIASVSRVDKVIVLRSVDNANRVQINFRAREAGDYGDLMVQEIRDCVFTTFTADGEIPIPHDLGEGIDVDVDLVGTNLTVAVNGDEVVQRDFPIAVQAGGVGFAIIDRSTTGFDDLIVDSLD